MDIAGRKPDREWLDLVIDTVGLRPRLAHRPSELSGGQQQRVACARALASRPEIVFADEPTGNLDSRSGADVLGFLRRSVREMGQTIVMVTHDPTAAGYADRVLFLADGRIVDEMADPTADRVLERMKAFDARPAARRRPRTTPRRQPADMWRTTYRSLLAHKLRLAMSGLAIVLGVAFVAGTLIFTDTLSKTFNDLFRSTAADVNVTRAAAFDQGLDGTGTGAGLLRAGRAGRRDRRRRRRRGGRGLASRPRASTSSTATATSSTPAARRASASAGTPRSRCRPPPSSTGGRRPAPDEVMIDTNAAEETGYRVGDTITVLTPGPRVEAELVGTFRFGDEGGLAGASLTAFDTATAQELLTAPGQFTGIGVAAADGVDDDELSDRVAAAVGADYDVKTATEQADDLASDFSEALQFINVFLLVFAGVALFVGTFIILNTFSMLVAQRTRELALLRALGASRSQVTRSVLAEALVMGVVGSTLGLVGRLRRRRRRCGRCSARSA